MSVRTRIGAGLVAVEKPIKAGSSVSFDFLAELQGAFEIEMHHGGGENPIADLRVVPG